MGPSIQRVPPSGQDQLIGWLASYFDTPAEVFRKMTPDKRWTVYQRISERAHYPNGDEERQEVVYH